MDSGTSRVWDQWEVGPVGSGTSGEWDQWGLGRFNLLSLTICLHLPLQISVDEFARFPVSRLCTLKIGATPSRECPMLMERPKNDRSELLDEAPEERYPGLFSTLLLAAPCFFPVLTVLPSSLEHFPPFLIYHSPSRCYSLSSFTMTLNHLE